MFDRECYIMCRVYYTHTYTCTRTYKILVSCSLDVWKNDVINNCKYTKRQKDALKEGLEETPWGKPCREMNDSPRLMEEAMLRLGAARKLRRLEWMMLFKEEYARDEAVSRVFFRWTHRFLPFRARVPSRAYTLSKSVSRRTRRCQLLRSNRLYSNYDNTTARRDCWCLQ